VRNRSTQREVSVITPTSSDPHKYIKLMLDSKRQKRLALRKVIAHCWLPEAGFKLGPDGYAVDGSVDVFYRNADPTDCSAANLEHHVVMGARQAQQQGVAITSRYGSRRDSRRVVGWQGRATAAGAHRQGRATAAGGAA
jgi:hypothetical protein